MPFEIGHTEADVVNSLTVAIEKVAPWAGSANRLGKLQADVVELHVDDPWARRRITRVALWKGDGRWLNHGRDRDAEYLAKGSTDCLDILDDHPDVRHGPSSNVSRRREILREDRHRPDPARQHQDYRQQSRPHTPSTSCEARSGASPRFRVYLVAGRRRETNSRG